ncbi:holdfast anchor protein HfaD [uncultured Brevundimonas sp.]|uniref:holdfast anchor protein HfaD n=1 Tax=uncultured Brevundimonas sp. TaxID=213418 RepID=UPI0030EF1C44
MARPARIRLAGTIGVTLLCAAAATEAMAQDGAIVLNNQIQLGDVVAGQTLNVVDADEQVTVSTSAQGNSFSGAVENGTITVDSTQEMHGDALATTTMTLGGDTAGRLTATTQAGGNYLAVGAYGADLSVDASQQVTDGEIVAYSTITDDSPRLLAGATVDASAIGNTAALGGDGATVTGTVSQESSATIRAGNLASTQYIPAQAAFSSQAMANAVAVNSDAASNQNLYVRQRSTGDLIESDASANAGNAWDLAGRARASANQAVLQNQGGALIAETDQSNVAQVRAAAITTAYDYGAAEAYARAAGNDVSVGNNDVYVKIDNAQFNSGGVDSTATFSGTNGYDVYVGADAVGNSVTGYACSECAGYLTATNVQTNNGSVTATASTTVVGSARAVITGTNAVGNAATFYVSSPGP